MTAANVVTRCVQCILPDSLPSVALEAEHDELRNRPGEPPILAPFLEEIGMSHEEFLASVRDWRTLDRFRQKR